jgi:hypothetical protein
MLHSLSAFQSRLLLLSSYDEEEELLLAQAVDEFLEKCRHRQSRHSTEQNALLLAHRADIYHLASQ